MRTEIQDLQKALQESMPTNKAREPWIPKTNYGRLLKLYLKTGFRSPAWAGQFMTANRSARSE